MLKMVSKKSMLLLGAVMALCAFVLPSVASAASWGPVNTTDGRIDSGNIGFSLAATGSGSSCTSTQFSVTVHSASLATITNANFAGCNGDIGSGVGCTTTAAGTGFPWRATLISTTNVVIDGVDIDVKFETKPGTLNECSTNGLTVRLTGNVSIGYTPNPGKTFDFAGATGLVAHIAGIGTNIPAAARGGAVATGALNIFN